MYSVELSPPGSGDKWLALIISPTKTAGWGDDVCLQLVPRPAVSATGCIFRGNLSAYECFISHMLSIHADFLSLVLTFP